MAVTPGQVITAAQYNGLQSRIATLLGTGSGNFGYGQSITSSQVSALTDADIPDGDTVSAAQMDALRSDLTKAYTHQTGNAPSIRNIAVGDIIGADNSGTDLTIAADETYTFVNDDDTGGFNDYLGLMDTIETNRFNIAPGQATEADVITDSRTSTWNGSISTEFSVTWPSKNAARYFFNAGGEIHIESNLSNGSGSKDADWADMLSNPGRIRFGYNYVTVDGSTTGVTITSDGWYDLTASSSTFSYIFEKAGNAAVYEENRYWVLVNKLLDESTLRFRVIFSDQDAGDQQPGTNPGPAVDEDITGDVTVTIGTRRPSGSNVSLPNPAISITSTLE